MNRTEQQQALWQQWHDKPGKKTLAPLLDSFEPMIKGYVSGLRNATLPASAVEGHARQQALDAFGTYKPGTAALSTHVGHRLRKTNRYVYTHQDVGRLPEAQILQTRAFRDAHDRLDERYGRPPSTTELADHLKWSPRQVARYQRGLKGSMRLSDNPLLESLAPDVGPVGFGANDTLKYLYTDLDPEEQLVFEHTFGWGGKPELKTNRDIARTARMSETKVRKIKKNILSYIEQFEKG